MTGKVALQRTDKTMSLADAVAQIPQGARIGIGGVGLENKPMAFVREIVRQQKRNLTVVFPAPASIDADILIGAGCVAEMITAGVSIPGYAPIAPRFRSVDRTSGGPRIINASEGLVIAGLRAAAFGAPSQPTVAGLGTDFPEAYPDWFAYSRDPFTGDLVTSVRAMRLDFALVHVTRSDSAGHGQHLGSELADRLLVSASDRTLISCEAIVGPATLAEESFRTLTLPFRVTGVVANPGGAAPTAASAVYAADPTHLAHYAQLAKTQAGFDQYLAQYVFDSTGE